MGHISVRDPERADRFLLARSIAPEQVTAADVLVHDLDGAPIDARGRAPYRERFIHSEIYRARADVKAIVHCHTPSLIPFADSDVPLRAMYHMAAFIASGVPVFDIRKAAGITDLLISDAKLGRALAQTLADKHALLIRHHGAVVVASSIPNVVGRSVYLDLNARVQMQATALGGHVTSVDPAEAKLRMADPNEYSRAWDLWKAKLSK
jgi:HCOMODA/2-hydroxy-3-carboxy-muconic semialdehyde decarboxylase